jgi:hypothetical protein
MFAFSASSFLPMNRKMTENPRDGAGNRRTRSQAAPEWTVTESLILVNEIAAVEADCSVEFSSYQQWDIISENCAALDVDRNLAQCRRKWRSLLAEYDDVRKGRRSSNLDPELFDAIGRVVKGREERGEIDRESDAEIGNEDLDATVEIETGMIFFFFSVIRLNLHFLNSSKIRTIINV